MIKKIEVAKLLIVFFIFYSNSIAILAQSVDSVSLALKKSSDSLKFIPLVRELRNQYDFIHVLDTNETNISPISFFGLRNLNNYGSPVNFSREGFQFSKDLNIGFHYADFYYTPSQLIEFVKSNKTYVELLISEGMYVVNSQSGLVDNLNASAFVTKNFAHHVDLNFTYDRINQKGIYQNSRNFLGKLKTVVQYQNPNDRWTFSIGYSNDEYKFGNSGGIQSDSLLLDTKYRVRESIPVNSSSSYNSIVSNQYFGTTSFRFSKDSMFFNPKIYLESSYKSYNNLFLDQERRSPNQLYGLSFLKDTNGIERNHLQFSSYLTTGVHFLQSKIWNLGIKLSYTQHHIIQDSSFRSDISVFMVEPTIGWRSNNTSLIAEFVFKEQQHKSLQSFKITATRSLNENDFVKVALEKSTDLPSLLEQKLFVNNRLIWQHDFSHVSSLLAALAWKTNRKYFPDISVQIGQLKNFTYLNSNGKILQSDDASKYFNIELQEMIPIGNIGTTHRFKSVFLEYDYPGWSGWNSKHELYWKFKLGKNSTRTKLAAKFDIVQQKNLNGYNPLLGMYYVVNKIQKVYGPFVGLNFEVQIADLKVKLSAEHLDSFWNSNRPQLVKGYPVYDFGVRIELLWRFLN